MISSKHSHTFAHFWLSARYKNRLEIVSKTASLLEALKNGAKNDIFLISGRFGFRTGSNIGPQNWPKTDLNRGKIVWQSLQSLQDAPKMAPNLENHPKICKNLQKWCQHGRIMGPKFYQNPCQKRLSRERFHGRLQICNNVKTWATTIQNLVAS